MIRTVMDVIAMIVLGAGVAKGVLVLTIVLIMLVNMISAVVFIQAFVVQGVRLILWVLKTSLKLVTQLFCFMQGVDEYRCGYI